MTSSNNLQSNYQQVYFAQGQSRSNNNVDPLTTKITLLGGLPALAADTYYNVSNYTPDKHLKDMETLSQNIEKIEGLSTESKSALNDTINSIREKLNAAKNKNPGFFERYIMNQRKEDAQAALSQLEGKKLEIPEGASETAKKEIEKINAEIERLIKIAKGSLHSPNATLKQAFISGLKDYKFSLVALGIATAGVKAYRYLTKSTPNQ